MRNFVTRTNAVLRIVDFGGLPIFEDAKDTYVCIPLVRKDSISSEVEICKITNLDFQNLNEHVSSNSYLINADQLRIDGWSLENQVKVSLFQKIMGAGKSLGEYSSGRIYYGIKTGLNDAVEITPDQYEDITSKAPHCEDLIRLFVGGQDIRRYRLTDNQRFLIVIPSGWTNRQLLKLSKEKNPTENYAWEWFSEEYESLADHLSKFSNAAKKRQDKGDYWWELRPCDYYDVLDSPKRVFLKGSGKMGE